MKAFKDFKRTQGIAATRTRLGLTQEVFAGQLGISRSMLSRVESKQRNLPINAMVKLAALEVAIGGNATATRSVQPHPAELDGYFANSQEQADDEYKTLLRSLKAEKWQLQLEQMEQRYKALRLEISSVESLLKHFAEQGDADTGFTMLFRLQHQSMLRKLAKCSLPQQTALRHKIVLHHAAAELEALHLEKNYEAFDIQIVSNNGAAPAMTSNIFNTQNTAHVHRSI